MTELNLKNTIAGFLKIPENRLGDNVILTDLVTESFILVELVMYLQDELGVRIVQDDLKNVKDVGQLISLFRSKQYQN